MGFLHWLIDNIAPILYVFQQIRRKAGCHANITQPYYFSHHILCGPDLLNTPVADIDRFLLGYPLDYAVGLYTQVRLPSSCLDSTTTNTGKQNILLVRRAL